jgi:hypothetical protein
MDGGTRYAFAPSAVKQKVLPRNAPFIHSCFTLRDCRNLKWLSSVFGNEDLRQAHNPEESLARTCRCRCASRWGFFAKRTKAAASCRSRFRSYFFEPQRECLRPVSKVIPHLEKNGVFVAPPIPAMEKYIRVSLGTPAEMQEFWRVWDLMPAGKMAM